MLKISKIVLRVNFCTAFTPWLKDSEASKMSSLRNCVSRMFNPSSVLPAGTRQSDILCKSQRLMLETGLIRPSSPGAFHLLPLAVRAMEKLSLLIDREMRSLGGQKLAMPTLGSGKLWKKSGRWDMMGAELLTLKDRRGTDYCLSPTHEEAVTDMIAAEATLSHKNLPLLLYQISTKFRDEPRPRYGLLRGREFTMKDMYTFDVSREAALSTYQAVCDAYHRIFQRLGLNVVQAVGDSGVIGGDTSHEFILPAAIGEDTIHHCPRCGLAVNTEATDSGEPLCPESLSRPACEITQKTGIELGHTFLLGQKYSEVFGAGFIDSSGKRRNCEMGCYGLGVSRILASSIEALSTDDEVRWPRVIAPYQLCIIPPKYGSKEEVPGMAEGLYDDINSRIPHLEGELLIDDRTSQTIGRRLKDATKKGLPIAVIIGKKAQLNPPQIEVHVTETSESIFLTNKELVEYLKTNLC